MNSMKVSTHTYKVIVTVIILGSVALQNSCLPVRPPDQTEYLVPLQKREVGLTTLQLHEEWRVSNLTIPFFDPVIFYSKEDQLIFIEYEANGAKHWLNVLDAKSGTEIWRTFPASSAQSYWSVTNQDKLYLLVAPKIIAYDLNTGNQIWETKESLPDRTVYRMHINGDKLVVYSAEDIYPDTTKRVVRIYNSNDGMLENIENEIISQEALYLLMADSNDYWTDRVAVWSINNQTKQRQWTVTIDGSIQYQPLIVDNVLIYASGIFSDVIGVDKATGTQLWKFDNKIVSNLAVESGILYAICEDAAVVGINVFTGKEIGRITMAPDVTEGPGSRSTSYLVAANNDMVFVYYGDSRELIAFTKDNH